MPEKLLLSSLFCAILFACKPPAIARLSSEEQLKGKWIRITEPSALNYPGLEFGENNSAVFSSFGDTIYYFNYHLKHNELILRDGNDKVSHNLVTKLTKDSLIFRNLLEHTTPQV